MSKVDSYKCDQCGKQMGETTNGWWVALPPVEGLPTVTISPFEHMKESPVQRAQHLCGVECATKWVGGQLVKLNEAPPTNGG